MRARTVSIVSRGNIGSTCIMQSQQPLLLTSASHTRGWHIHRASYITEGHSVESLCLIIENLHCQFEGVWCDSWCTITRSCDLWMMYVGKQWCIHVLYHKAYTMKYSWQIANVVDRLDYWMTLRKTAHGWSPTGLVSYVTAFLQCTQCSHCAFRIPRYDQDCCEIWELCLQFAIVCSTGWRPLKQCTQLTSKLSSVVISVSLRYQVTSSGQGSAVILTTSTTGAVSCWIRW